MTGSNCCGVCKVFGLLVILGALNWLSIGVANLNFVEHVLGAGTTATKVVYIVIGIAGLAKIISCFKMCPACKKS